ncbi:PREDICTED: selenoprotein S A-like [Dinoponera quadriceps]|uniref:Selenoprotein S A-like n=1 Tax=Dinoponera quadriceps TaxID=609295 RepID=A0A6P3YBI7_DINQU|nr:PREDICTED: selenoprotein S A-like [Dinoponera quadriceps]
MESYGSSSYFQIIWSPIASVGWYIVGLLAITYYVYPHIQRKYKNWKLVRNQQDDTVHCKKTDQLSRTSADVELVRQKLQETYNLICAVAKLEEEVEKEKKRQKVIKMLEDKEVGRRLGSASDNEAPSTSSNSKPFKSSYNPLMGDGIRRYRPPKRSCCGKGGCG